MIESRQRVRAVARVSSEPRAAGPPILRPGRRPGHLGPVHVLQLLLVEAVLVAVLVALAAGPPIVIASTAAAGALLLLVVLTRRHGRWWLERRMMARRFLLRQRASAPSPGVDPRLGSLRSLAPGLTVEEVRGADGAQVGVARDDAGWFAVATVSGATAMRDDPDGVLPLDLLATALAEIRQPGAVLQIVRFTVPAQYPDIDPGSAVSQSYRQLVAGLGTVPVPVDCATWIAVRLEARSLAEAAGLDVDLVAAPAVVAAMVRAVAKSLRRVGISYQVLDAAGLVAALARSCDLEPQPLGGAQAEPREDWSAWHSARLSHRTFWVSGWPGVEHAAPLLHWLSSAPAAMTNVALILTPDEDDLMDLRCLVRVSAPEGRLDHISDVVAFGAKQARAELFPLNGEQGPAVYASAPTGGGAR
jgi:type VII secretion protein EccE